MLRLKINPAEGPISSAFGYRTSPVTGKAEFHNGIDIAVPIGTEVVAVANGTITVSGKNELNGYYIRLRTDSGYMAVYLHLSEILVDQGQQVVQGEVIALSGNSGVSAGAHLHVSLLKNGEFIDPFYYFTLVYNGNREG